MKLNWIGFCALMALCLGGSIGCDSSKPEIPASADAGGAMTGPPPGAVAPGTTSTPTGAGSSAVSPPPGSRPGAPQSGEPGAVNGLPPGPPDQMTVAIPIEEGIVKLNPNNSKIGFIGTHVGADPDPNARHGGFAKFTGQAEVDKESSMLKSVALEIDTTSLWSPQAQLTEHLLGPDFFDTREHPTAKFTSTKIEAGAEAAQFVITGDFTLLGNTKPLTVPATVGVSKDGLTLKAAITIDRTEFGMEKLTDKVEKKVAIEVVIGQRTIVRQEAPKQ